MKILICADIHCRDFWKPVLKIKDRPIVFLGDYLDPYWWEGFNSEKGIEDLKRILEFARENNNVILLIGNHCLSHIFSYYGCERTGPFLYKQTHKLYRDNIDLLKPYKVIDDTLFIHAGICEGWVKSINRVNEINNKDFRITGDNVLSFIDSEFKKALENPNPTEYFYDKSRIFDIGRSRGGNAPYGGPFWYDYRYEGPAYEDLGLFQVVGHCQQEITGSLGKGNGLICCDSRAIFEYDTETKKIIKKDIL